MYQRNRYQIRREIDPRKYHIINIPNHMDYMQQFYEIPEHLKYKLPIYIEVYDLQSIFSSILPRKLRLPSELYKLISEHLINHAQASIVRFTRFLRSEFEVRMVKEHVPLLRSLRALKRQVETYSDTPPMISFIICDLSFEDRQTAMFYLSTLVNNQSRINYEISKKIQKAD